MAAKRPVNPQNLGIIAAAGADRTLAERAGLSAPASLAMVRALQTTLELEPLLALFQTQATSSVPFSALRYRFAELGIDAATGRRGVHSCNYRLQFDGEYLGEIEFSGRSRFSDADQAQLESLLTFLIHPLRNALCYWRALSAAQRDHLTGAYTRRVLDDTLRHELDLARRNGSPVALVLLDLDHFKAVNTNHGHLGGDTVLRVVAGAVQGCIRSCDLLFRYGGEEFVVMARNCVPAGTEFLAERIRTRIETLDCHYGDVRVPITASLGLSSYRAGDDAASLIGRADRALRQAKVGGRNQVVVS